MSYRVLLFSTLVLSLAFPIHSFSEEAPVQDNLNQYSVEKQKDIDEMLLFWEPEELFSTATKHPLKISEAPAVATVITAEEIKNMGAKNLADVLKRVPGFGVTRGFFGLYEIELRGIKTTYSEEIKILLDGHSLNTTVNGGASWPYDRMPLNNVKRIEIIRGPGSALYGSNALAGVINIITNDGSDMDGAIAAATYGSYDTGEINLQTGKRFDKLDLALALDYFDTAGPELKVDQDAYDQSGDTDDSEKRFDAYLKARYGDFTLKGKYVARKRGPYIGVINAVNDGSDIRHYQYFGDLSYKKSINDDLTLTIRGYIDGSDWTAHWQLLPENLYPYFSDGMIGVPSHKERDLGSELQLDYKPNERHLLTIGAMYENREIYDVTVDANYCSDPTNTECVFGTPLDSLQDVSNRWNWLDEKSRYLSAYYIQDQWTPVANLGITGGVRHDEYSDFGGTTNPRVAAVWKFSEGWDAKLMYGEAFRAPSNAELDIKNNPAYTGNPDLDPEKMKTYEVSIGHLLPRRASYRLSYFYSKYTDKIQPTGTDLEYENIGEAKIDGIETEFKWYFGRDASTYLGGNYTRLWTEDEETGDDLPEIAEDRGNIELNIGVNRYLNINMNVLMVGEKEHVDERKPIPAYAVVDLGIRVKNLYKGLELRGYVNNLFDQDYEDPSVDTTPYQVSDVPREGINGYITAEYKF